MDNYILDENGEPLKVTDFIEWAKYWVGKEDKRRVAYDKIGDVTISTAFLNMDHSYRQGDPPVLWETMIFGGINDQWQDRYTSKEEALIGHKVCVERTKLKRKMDDDTE